MTVGRDDNPRIPYFLEYYRKLGINHFLFVDHMSESPMADILVGQDDVSIWRTEQNDSDAGSGVDWINALLSRYAVSHWVLTVDLDEFFVYPFMESRSFDDLLAFHDDIEKPCMFTMQVDMYPEGLIASNQVPIGESPLKYAPFFDRDGYLQSKGNDLETCVRGGPRMRMLQATTTDHLPLLNKTPLIKWRARYAYSNRTHVAFPPLLNMAHQKYHVPTGALLHFKLKELEGYVLYGSNSARYIGSQSLVEANLMTPGGWK